MNNPNRPSSRKQKSLPILQNRSSAPVQRRATTRKTVDVFRLQVEQQTKRSNNQKTDS